MEIRGKDPPPLIGPQDIPPVQPPENRYTRVALAAHSLSTAAGGTNVLLFIESGRPGVPWVRPAFVNVQETPYTFHAPSEFSCAPNRGGTAGSLLQVNHWIETTPAPRPSNAAIVNARDVLLPRLDQCARERAHQVNIVAVDFYRSGDLLAVVAELNGIVRAGPASTPAASSD